MVSRPPLPPLIRAESDVAWMDDDVSTWGLKAVGLGAGTGRDVRVAILDTGFGPSIDFNGRAITARSFVPGADTSDENGHGTMCAGIACGSRTPGGQRYGIASEAHLFVGKVLTAAGVGRPEWVLAGLEWAIAEGCQVVSLSLGMEDNAPEVLFFDSLAESALHTGTVVIAAAGDRAPRPIQAPASSPYVIGVGAIDPGAMAWESSCPSGGADERVDVAAPGVAVLSTVPHPPGVPVPCYHYASGTSLAAPHVAGVAALLFERGLSAAEVRARIVGAAKPLPKGDARTVGTGLVQAP